MYFRAFPLFIILLHLNYLAAGDTIRVHFLYGSKPLKAWPEEPKWFGGILGGHVGVEIDSGQVLHFLPSGGMHIFGRKISRHSAFYISPLNDFWEVLGCCDTSVKKLSISITVDSADLKRLKNYGTQCMIGTPYDYAFFGMRCGSATYDVLQQAGLLRKRSHIGQIFGIFYPRKLRKRLIRKAEMNHWPIYRQPGTSKRKWERD